MLLVFQIVFTLFALAAIVAVIRRKKERLLGSKGVIFWIIFWLFAIAVVLWPESASYLASALGIGRGADLVLYISVALIFFLLFKLHVKIESTARDITRLTRDRALQQEKERR